MPEKRLSILITVHNETLQDVYPLLTSLAAQQRVDWEDIEVLMFNDGGSFNYSKLDMQLPFRIHYVKHGKKGVALNRQELLKNATGKYVMFCDADDSFYQVNALYLIIKQIEADFKVLVSCFFEEVYLPDTKEYIFIPHSEDKVFIHGKVYNRQFLVNNSINWIDVCPCEDSYFNKLALAIAGEMKYIQDPLYLWKYRANSIVRSDLYNWEFDSHVKAIAAQSILVDELINRGLLGNARYEILYQILQTYFAVHSQRWFERESALKKTEKVIGSFIKTYQDYIQSIDENFIKKMFDANLDAYKQRGFIETESLSQWLERIKQ